MRALLSRCDQGAILLRYENRPAAPDVIVQRRFKFAASHPLLGLLAEAQVLLATDSLALEEETDVDGTPRREEG